MKILSVILSTLGALALLALAANCFANSAANSGWNPF